MILQVEQFFLDLFFPRRCVVCRNSGAWLCVDCSKKQSERFLFEPIGSEVYGLFAHEDSAARELLYGLKYGGLYESAEVLMDVLHLACSAEDLLRALQCSKDPVVVPVPVSYSRLKSRGYNQAELLARVFARWAGLPMNTQILHRRAGKTLVGQGRRLRQRAAQTAFYIGDDYVVEKNSEYILIDDVVTTGSTLKTCRKILLDAGAARVVGVAFAYKHRFGG